MVKILERRVGVYSPYDRSETTFATLFLANYLDRELANNREKSTKGPCRVSFMSPDIPIAGISEQWDRSVLSARRLTDDQFQVWASEQDVMFWLVPDKERLKLCPERINHYLFCDIRYWTNEVVKFSRECSAVIVPSVSLRNRMRTLVWSRDIRTVYSDSGYPIHPVKTLEDDRLNIIISLFGVKNMRYRFDVLRMVAILLKMRSDLFVTVLLDGQGGREEQKLIDAVGFQYSGSCVFLNEFTDWQFYRIIDRSDVFVDLNTSPSNCFMLYSAIQRGVCSAGFDVEPNKDVLASGEIGYTIPTDVSLYGFEFESAVPDVKKVFKELNRSLFNRDWILRFKEKQRDSCVYYTELEKRRRLFTEMWGTINGTVKKGSSVAAFQNELETIFTKK
jgi:hypothetical protein